MSRAPFRSTNQHCRATRTNTQTQADTPSAHGHGREISWPRNGRSRDHQKGEELAAHKEITVAMDTRAACRTPVRESTADVDEVPVTTPHGPPMKDLD